MTARRSRYVKTADTLQTVLGVIGVFVGAWRLWGEPAAFLALSAYMVVDGWVDTLAYRWRDREENGR